MSWITQQNRAALRAMQGDALNVLGRRLHGIRECALVDFPDHPNVGDSMIWLGELALLSMLGIKIRYVCSSDDYDADALRRSVRPDGAILIHGGGNFGTLYVRHQRLRESVLSHFPDRRIIQLPQSINFDRGDVLSKTQHLIESHRNFTLLVRDQTSRAFAAAHFNCETELCPDMALMLGPLANRRAPNVDYFLLSRTDKEKGVAWSGAEAQQDSSSWRQADWLEGGTTENVISRATGLTRRVLGGVQVVNGLWEAAYHQGALARLRRGIRTLGQGRVVLTDRLHAHVLCVLMGKPHVVLGDSHGKIRAFFDAYSSRLSPAPWADRSGEAFDAARALLRSG